MLYEVKYFKVISLFTVITLLFVAVAISHSLSSVERIGNDLLAINEIQDWNSNRNAAVDGVVNIGKGLYGILTEHEVPIESLVVSSELGDCFNSDFNISSWWIDFSMTGAVQ